VPRGLRLDTCGEVLVPEALEWLPEAWEACRCGKPVDVGSIAKRHVGLQTGPDLRSQRCDEVSVNARSTHLARSRRQRPSY
jgi:hypothetical protein